MAINPEGPTSYICWEVGRGREQSALYPNITTAENAARAHYNFLRGGAPDWRPACIHVEKLKTGEVTKWWLETVNPVRASQLKE